MYEQHLIQAGLSNDQAQIYEILLKNGPLKAGKISQKTTIKRGLVYKILEQLVEFGLIEKNEQAGGVAIFMPAHPLKIKDLIEERQKKAKDAELALSGVLPSIISDFNLISGRPGVEVYEGLDGIKRVLEDSLTNNFGKQILTFSDVAGYSEYLTEWNTDYYAPKRKRLGIREKVIIPDNKKALTFMEGYQSTEVTEVLFIDHQLFPFATEINIYEDKVSFITFSEKGHIGVIVENKEIFQSLTSIFNFCWELGRKYYKDKQPDLAQRYDQPKLLPAQPGGPYQIPPDIG